MNRYTWRTGTLEGVMIVVGLIFLLPIYILVNLSLRPASDRTSPLIPTFNPTFDNYVQAWVQSNLGGAMLNSIVITATSVVLLVVLGSLAAYGLVRSTARWSAPAFYVFVIGLLIPFQLGLIPLYKQFATIGAMGTVIPLIAIYSGLRLPFTIFLFSSFLRQIPIEYEEAARIDGASTFGTFRHVVFPLLRPVTGTVIILNSLFAWNDFLTPVIYLSGTKNATVPLAVYSFVNDNVTHWPLVFAALVIGVIPVLVVFFILQKKLIQGFASGLKG